MPGLISIRRATESDLDYLVEKDLAGEGYSDAGRAEMGEAERLEQREKIASFVREADEAGWVAVDAQSGQRVGMILARYRDRLHEADTEPNRFLFRYLDADLFPADGRFCELFNLWVDPAFRRRGIATRLKLEVESEARRRGMSMIWVRFI